MSTPVAHALRRLPVPLVLLAALALPAFAAGWSNFDNAFPANPCQDGWAACLTDGGPAGPGALRDAAGRPLPADARFGWFDLQPTANVSPFVGLSAYSGPIGAQAAAPPPAPVSRPVASTEPRRAPDAASGTTSGAGARTTPTPAETNNYGSTTPTTSAPPMASNTTTTTSGSGGMRPGSPSTMSTTTATEPSSGGGMRPGSPSNTTSTPTSTTTTTVSSPPSTPTNTVVNNPPPSTPTTTSVVAPTTVAQNDACDDLITLEPGAMMGQLRTGQTKCLNDRVGSESQQTTKDKISRLLITNAEAKGDKAEWERLMKRHLEDIDRSDPDLCFKYALHLSRGGVGRAQGVIRWSDYALENKSKWSGTTYKSRVFALYKLRAEAANKLWQDAEKDYMEKDHSDENEAKAAKYRGQAKDYSREWLDYAKASTQDTKTAMALCVSSSGNRAFCEGG